MIYWNKDKCLPSFLIKTTERRHLKAMRESHLFFMLNYNFNIHVLKATLVAILESTTAQNYTEAVSPVTAGSTISQHWGYVPRT